MPLIGAFDDDRELIAVLARDKGCAVVEIGEALRDRAKNLIAIGMAKHIDNELKTVETDNEEGDFVRTGPLRIATTVITTCKRVRAPIETPRMMERFRRRPGSYGNTSSPTMRPL